MNPEQPSRPLSDAEATAEARRIITEAYRGEPEQTRTMAYRDTSPVPVVGDAQPVAQPDSRIVPPWASGIAVASLGIGAGVTGIGCGAWLVLQGLSAITVTGVLAICAPFLGLAVVATAVGAAVTKTKADSSTHIYEGTVIKRTEVSSTTRGMFSRTRIER